MKLLSFCFSLVLAAGSLSPCLVHSQTGRRASKPLPSSAFKLIAIRVTGTTRYTPEQIIAATGLQLGQKVSEDDFKAASRLLGQSGAFTNVGYAFQFAPEGTKVNIQLQDADQFVPARFNNFVWLSSKDLIAKLRARVPLFDGQLPVAGNLPDQVSDALQALAIEHNVQGRADYLRFARGDGPIEAFVYTISGPVIRIRNVEFAGAAGPESGLLQTAAKPLQGQDYLLSSIRMYGEKDLLPIYLARGYLKAGFSEPTPKVVEDSPQEVVVDITLPVEPGQQYKVADIQLNGNKVFPTEQLRERITQKLGTPADAVQLGKDLQEIKRLYGTRGYMAAAIQPTSELDDATGTVKYTLQCKEGEQYKMGDLDIEGLDVRTTTHLVDKWKLRGGDVFDGAYPGQFVNDSLKEVSAMGDWDTRIHYSLDERDKVVDVTVRFDPKR